MFRWSVGLPARLPRLGLLQMPPLASTQPRRSACAHAHSYVFAGRTSTAPGSSARYGAAAESDAAEHARRHARAPEGRTADRAGP